MFTEEQYKEVIEVLNQEIAKQGLKPADIAKISGINRPQSLNNVLKGRRVLKPEFILAFLDVLGLRIDIKISKVEKTRYILRKGDETFECVSLRNAKAVMQHHLHKKKVNKKDITVLLRHDGSKDWVLHEKRVFNLKEVPNIKKVE